MASSSSISVKKAYKSYGKSEVLKNLSIEVQKGTIYGLLGASGCGKTTLLNCLIGRTKVDSGEIWILGSAPSDLNTNPIAPTVGYMPQELGLVGEFTVQDALYFFGRIANMPDKAIKEQSSLLTEILDLPSENKLLKKCSGGQQRRISFACSLIHKPEFLVLDEPTVGADPLVRERGLLNFVLIPIVLVGLFFIALGGEPKQLPLGVVNSEMNSKQCFNVKSLTGKSKSCRFENLSCRFLSYFDGPLIDIVQYNSLEMALEAAKKGKTLGALYFPDDFTHSFEKRVRYSPMSDKQAEKNYFNHSEIKVWLDMSNQIIGNAVRSTLLDMYREFIQDLLIPCGYKLKHLDFFSWNYIYENADGSFKISWLPGVIITFMFFFGCLVCCELLLNDRLQGIWERSAVAGVSSLEIILSHLTLQSIFVAFHTFEIFALVFLVYRVKHVGNMWIMVLIGYLQGVVGIIAGFTISIVCDAVSTANMVTFAIFFVMYAISGVWWPISGMPIVLQWISNILPFPLAIDAVRDVMFKGWSIDNQKVLLGVGMELAWIVGLLVLNIILLRFKKIN